MISHLYRQMNQLHSPFHFHTVLIFILLDNHDSGDPIHTDILNAGSNFDIEVWFSNHIQDKTPSDKVVDRLLVGTVPAFSDYYKGRFVLTSRSFGYHQGTRCISPLSLLNVPKFISHLFHHLAFHLSHILYFLFLYIPRPMSSRNISSPRNFPSSSLK